MPSHLDQSDEASKREELIQDGTINEDDIYGNDQADELAKIGVGRHAPLVDKAKASQDRRIITMTAQKTWKAYMEDASPEIKAADANDTLEVIHEELLRQEYYQHHEDYDDSDRFESIAIDGHEATDSIPTSAAAPGPLGDSEVTVEHYPNYGWNLSDGPNQDADLSIKWDLHEDPTKLGNVNVRYTDGEGGKHTANAKIEW